jgi:hypothetical protein
MTWKWNLREAHNSYKECLLRAQQDFLDLDQLLKESRQDNDIVHYGGQRQTVREAEASINNMMVAQCKSICSQLSWEDQITFVTQHMKDQPYLFYCLDEVQRSVVVLLS